MNQTDRDALAEKTITSVVNNFVGRDRIRKIYVNPVENSSGEPSLYINVHLKRGEYYLDLERRSELREAINRELERIDENRFPYLSIIGSSWHSDGSEERKTA